MRRIVVLYAPFVVAALPADAGQPLFTDDAAVVAPGHCQVEAWLNIGQGSRAAWAVPACNVAGFVELAAGGAATRDDQAGTSGSVVLQTKAVLPAASDAAWNFGGAIGALRVTSAPHGSSAFQTYYLKGLASWHPAAATEVDLNVGAANVYGTGTFTIGGVALQQAVAQNVQLLAEWFRDEPGASKYQVGVRSQFVPNRFEGYVSYGNRFDRSHDWWTIVGIRLQFALSP